MMGKATRKAASGFSRCSTARRVAISIWAGNAGRRIPARQAGSRFSRLRRNSKSFPKARPPYDSRMPASANSPSSGQAVQPEVEIRTGRTPYRWTLGYLNPRTGVVSDKEEGDVPGHLLRWSGTDGFQSRTVEEGGTAVPFCCAKCGTDYSGRFRQANSRDGKVACRPSEASELVSARPPSFSLPNWSPL